MILNNAPEGKEFYFADGTKARNLEELKNKIEQMSYEEFYNHVNEYKNDFANWIEFVLGGSKLADKLRKVQSIVETVEILEEEINPELIAKNEEELGDDDFQKLIEDTLFKDLEEKEERINEEVGETGRTERTESAEDKEKIVETPLPDDKDGEPLTKDELEALTKEAKPISIKEREPILTNKGEKHTPITESEEGALVKKVEQIKKYYNQLIIKEALMGFLIGLIAGLILGRIISYLMG